MQEGDAGNRLGAPVEPQLRPAERTTALTEGWILGLG